MGMPLELVLTAVLLLTSCTAQEASMVRWEIFPQSNTCQEGTMSQKFELPEGTCAGATDAEKAVFGLPAGTPWLAGIRRRRHCLCVCRRGLELSTGSFALIYY